MLIRRIVVRVFSVSMTVLGSGLVCGQTYPNKPTRIVTADAGGGSDFVARLIAQGISARLGQPVIVDNRRSMAPDIVAKAPPDGYTLLLFGNAMWTLPFMRDNVPYDPVRDFSPITLAVNTPNILVVHPSLPINSVKELITMAKARPGALNYGSSATGTASHLAGELFKAMAGVNIVRIPYKGAALAISDLLSGQVQLAFFTPTSVMPHVKTGKLRALAVTGAQPSALAPELPTMAASGLPGYESAALHAVFATAKTPATVIKRLNQEIVRVLSQAEVKLRLLNAGAEVVGSSPQELASTIKSEMASMGKVIKDAGIREE